MKTIKTLTLVCLLTASAPWMAAAEETAITEKDIWQTYLKMYRQRPPNCLGMEFISIAPGSFRMGSNDGYSNQKPVHTVRISHRFWMGKFEVTQAEYETLTGKNPSDFKGGRNPVETVSWHDAKAFCEELTDRQRRAGRLPDGYVYRLPTEAEWEYAARGGNKSRGFKHSGSNRVFRGGCWFGPSWIVRSANRFRNRPGYSYDYLGFRVCLAPQIRE